MEDHNSEIDRLLIKKLTSSLSDDEEAVLNAMLKKNPLPGHDLPDYDLLWKAAGKLRIKQGLPAGTRWEKLQEKIKEEAGQSAVAHRRVFLPRVWLRYAAVFIVVAISAALYFNYPRSKSVEIKTLYGEIRTITLPDESVVRLNAATTLTYDESNWAKERILYLEGEAFFEVKKNGLPFTVSSDNAVVRVLGTSFNVKARDSATAIVCLTGRVSVGKLSDPAAGVILSKGLAVTVKGDTMTEIFTPDNEKITGWMRGDIHFDSVPLQEVFRDLEIHFNRSIVLQKETGSQTFTGWFKKPEFGNIMQTVCLSAGLSWSVKNDSTIVVQ